MLNAERIPLSAGKQKALNTFNCRNANSVKKEADRNEDHDYHSRNSYNPGWYFAFPFKYRDIAGCCSGSKARLSIHNHSRRNFRIAVWRHEQHAFRDRKACYDCNRIIDNFRRDSAFHTELCACRNTNIMSFVFHNNCGYRGNWHDLRVYYFGLIQTSLFTENIGLNLIFPFLLNSVSEKIKPFFGLYFSTKL